MGDVWAAVGGGVNIVADMTTSPASIADIQIYIGPVSDRRGSVIDHFTPDSFKNTLKKSINLIRI